MITKEQAINIARQFIENEFGSSMELKNDSVHEHQFVYVFYFQPRHTFYIAGYTDVIMYPGPNLIDKHDGSITSYSPGESEGEVIIRYYNEKEYTHNLQLTEDREIDDSSEDVMDQDDIDKLLKELLV